MSQLRSTIMALLTAVSVTSLDVQARQITVTIGEQEVESRNAPYGNRYACSTSQMIYTKEEIGTTAGPIKALAFNVSYASPIGCEKLQIYIGKSATTTFSSAKDNRSVNGMTLVYDGSPQIGSNSGWERIDFQTAYQYDGNSNLVVVVGRQNPSCAGNLNYYATEVSNQCLYRGTLYKTTAYGDPSNTSYSYSLQSSRPDIQFMIGEDQLCTKDGIIYLIDNGKAYAHGYESTLEGDITIASQVTDNGKTYSVVGIEPGAFERCTTITSVTIPTSIKQIDDYAFYGCTGLTSITLPSGLTRLGAHALQCCSSLTEVSIPDGIPSLEPFCLARCTKLTNVEIPASVKRIEAGALGWCSSLTTVNLPEQLNHIGPFAFKYCTKLQSIVVPAQVDSIALHAFYYCYRMTSVSLPEGLTSIGDFAFYDCGLTSLALPSTLTRIGKYGLANNSFSMINLPEGLTQLEPAALANNSNLARVTIPSSITELSEKVLYNCSSLKTVTLPSTLTRIGKKAFAYSPVKIINWPEHLTSIGYQAFAGSDEAGTHVIPENLTDIDCMLFYGIPYGSSYFCYSRSLLPENVFLGQNLTISTLFVRPELVSLYQASDLGKRFKAVKPIGDTNDDGVLSVGDVATLIGYIKGNSVYTLSGMTPGIYDVDGNGCIDAMDPACLGELIIDPATASSATTLTSSAHVTPIEVVSTVPDDCQLIALRTSLDSEAATSLDLLNQIRWEACLEGVWRSGYNHLSPEDYRPYIWSSDLESIARVRAIEAYYTGYHERLNGKSIWSITSNGVSGGGECLAPYSGYLGQLQAYYGEKGYWINKTSGQETGHYTAMILPNNKYVGLASCGSTGILQYTRYDEAGRDSHMLDDTGYQTFCIDILDSYITDHAWVAYVNGNKVLENFTVVDGTCLDLSYCVYASFVNKKKITRSFYANTPGIVYSSSNPEVATVDAETGRVLGLKVGTTTISAELDGTISTTTVTVTCNHEVTYGEPDSDLKVHGVCNKCGEEVEGIVPSSFSIYFTYSSSSYSSAPKSSYNVGEAVAIEMYTFTGGNTQFKKLILECDHPELLDVPHNAEMSKSWSTLGAGKVKVKAYLKYNPSVYRTYTINIVEPE